MVTGVALANCFGKTGILSVENRVNTESESLQDIIQASIDDLIITGLLATAQRPSAFDLLNPFHEHENVISTISDESIVEAVKEAHVQSLGGSAMEEYSKSCKVPANAEAILAFDCLNRLLSVRDDSWVRSISMQCYIAEKKLVKEGLNALDVVMDY